MKSKKNLIIGFLLLAFFTFVGYEMYSTVEDSKSAPLANRISKIQTDDVWKIEVQYGQMDLQLEKKDSVWEIVKPAEDMADLMAIKIWLESVLGQEGRQLLEDQKNIDWAEYGFDDPVGNIVLHAKKNTTYKVVVSAKDTFDRQTYLQITENNKPAKLFVGASEWRALVLKNQEEFQDLSLMSWSASRWESLSQISWTREQSPFAFVKEDNRWALRPLQAYKHDSAKIFSFLDDLYKFKGEGFIDESEAKSIVNNKPILTVKAQFGSEEESQETQTLSFYPVQKKNSLDRYDYFVYNSLRNKWFGLSEESLNTINPSLLDFIDFNLDVDIKTTQKLLISNVGIFEKENNIWKESKEMESKAKNGLEFDGAKVHKFLADLGEIKAARFEPQIQPNNKRIFKEIELTGEGWKKKLIVHNQVGSSIAGQELEDCYLVVEPDKGLPFWVDKESIEKLLLIEFYK